jgi:hypothetical protein
MTKKSGRYTPIARHIAKAKVKARRPTHKKVLLHPATIFLLLCTAVLVLGWTWKTAADSYTVKGKVAAPPLTEPAVITKPTDGAHFKTKPIEVSGTCPDDSYVKILRGGEFVGLANCDNTTNIFSLQVDLAPGANSLEAHDYNITDDEGPLSNPITVYYDPPVPPVPPATAQGSPSYTYVPQLVLTSDFQYRCYHIGETVSWIVKVNGGQPPFAVHVNWGDGAEANYVKKDNSELSVDHAYDKAGTFAIKITAVDVNGNQSSLQMFTIVVKDRTALIAGPISPSGRGPLFYQIGATKWFWPAYTIVVAMVLSFWLGEMQEVYVLTHHGMHGRFRRR